MSGGYSSLRCTGFSLWWLLLLRSTGSRCAGFSSCGSRALECSSVVVAHGLRCSAACGIFPDQGLNPCPLHWQVDSYPLRHQESPSSSSFFFFSISIGVWLLYNVVLVSSAQQNESAIHISPPFWASLPFRLPECIR